MKENNSENRILEKITFIEDLGYLYPKEDSKQKRRYGIYKCGFCGTNFKANTDNVVRGKTRSCGCYQKRRTSESYKTHGLIDTRLYSIWTNMKTRTTNINDTAYPYYGGRGITICDEWKNDFMSFYTWARENDYSDELSIDRIDNDRNYEPSNCRWTTPTIQTRNQRIYKNNKSGYKGVSYVKGKDLFITYINVNKKRIHLGYFKTAIEAGVAYNNYIIENNLEGFILNDINLTQEM